MLNKIILIGRLGTDPEIRFTAAGNSMTTFRLAVTTRERGADGKMVDHTEWFTVIAFGAQADLCHLWLRKGQQVYVEGRLRSRSFQGQDGVTRHVNEVLAHRVVFLTRTADIADIQEGPAAGKGEAPADEVAFEPEG